MAGRIEKHASSPVSKTPKSPRWPLAQGEGLTLLVHMRQPPTSWRGWVQAPRGPRSRRPRDALPTRAFTHPHLSMCRLCAGQVRGRPCEGQDLPTRTSRKALNSHCTNRNSSRGGPGLHPTPRFPTFALWASGLWVAGLAFPDASEGPCGERQR